MKKIFIVIFLALICAAWAIPSFAAEAGGEIKDPLLKKLVDKGTLTQDEAAEIQSKTKVELPKGLQGISIGGLAYFEYTFGETDNVKFNKFALTRAYINIRKDITPWFKARITPDLDVTASPTTQKGPATGKYLLKFKYVYADFIYGDMGPLTGNLIRAGMEQTPWNEFEESIWVYRMFSTIFQERTGGAATDQKWSSADLGLSFVGNFGGTLSKEQQDAVGYSTPYSGRYGGYHIGIYNGPGYDKTEANKNKVIEGRLTIRPLPDIIPGLQLAYFGIIGKGNDDETVAGTQIDDWNVNLAFLSYQNSFLVLTGQYLTEKGSAQGLTENQKGKGYSFYGDFRIPTFNAVSLFARYDQWDPNKSANNDKRTLVMGGVAYRITGNNVLVAGYEKFSTDVPNDPDDDKATLVLQVGF